MLDTKLRKTGSILMHEGKIQIQGFEGDNLGCREVCIHAMLWAIGELQKEVMEDIEKPGGGGNVSLDFNEGLCDVLSIDPCD